MKPEPSRLQDAPDAPAPPANLARRLWHRLDRCRPQTVFLIVVGLFGTACVFVTPPWQIPDEQAHLLRVDQLARGQVVAVRRVGPGGWEYGGEVPLSLYESSQRFARLSGHEQQRVRPAEIVDEFRRPLDVGRTRYLSFPNTALYSPVPYLPAVAAEAVARRFRPPPVVLLYAARLGTLAGYLAVGWVAVRVTPVLRWPAVVVLACPMCLFLAAGASADPLTTAAAVLFAAVVLRCRATPTRLTGRAALAVAAAAVALASCKSAYAPLALLACSVGPSRWTRRAYPLLAPVAAAVVVVGWSAVTHPTLVRERGGDPAVQADWVRHHPVAFAAVVGRTLRSTAGDLAYTAIGTLGWLDTPMPNGLLAIFYVSLAWLVVAYGEPVGIGAAFRGWSAAGIAGSVALIALGNYLVWTTTAAGRIEGLQGRYFLPLFVPAAAVLHRRDGYRVRPAWMAAALSAVGTYTLWTVTCRYYARAS